MSLRVFGILSLSVVLSTACVSKKKYVELEVVKNRLQSDSVSFVRTIDGQNEEIESLKSTLSDTIDQNLANRNRWTIEKDVLLTQINQQGIELDEKSEALRERAARLQELQSSLEDQTAATRTLRKAVADALINFSSDELQVSIENGRVKVSLSESLLFPSAGVNLDQKGAEALGKLAVVLKNNADVNIMIVGYTDSLAISTNRFRNNWDLSVVRATTIATILQEEYGVDGARLTAAGQGEFAPIASNASEEGRAMNRRTEIFLIPKLDALIDVLNEEELNKEGK